MYGRLKHLSPGVKLLVLFIMMLAALVLFYLIAGIIFMASYCTFQPDKEIILSDVKMLKVLQLIQSVLVFVLPSVVAAILFLPSSFNELFGEKKVNIKIVFASALTLIVSQYFIGWSGFFNGCLALPESMKGISDWIISAENDAKALALKLVLSDSESGFLFNVFLIAVLPAIGEEWLFRGHIQRYLKEWTGNVHVSVFITSVLFAALHMQFLTFLPRFFLGMILGYLFYFGGSLWYSVAGHFTNNFLALLFIRSKGVESLENGLEMNNMIHFSWVMVLISVVSTLGMLFIIRRNARGYR
ncbi:MAG: CPBP family intramembrane metalloprotease [Chlorobi bacterium]|nr:CPBP family intramembrane metalloprotease [Chlorobiota bacterium]